MLFRLILKRYLHRWKFLVVVFAGMLLSSSTMSGSLMYFDSLRDIALDFELAKVSSEKMDIVISSSEKPLMGEKYLSLKQDIESQLTRPLERYSNQTFYGVKSSTFLPTEWNEGGEDLVKGATSKSTSLCNSEEQILSNSVLEICKRYYFTYFGIDSLNRYFNIGNNAPLESTDESYFEVFIDRNVATFFNINIGDLINIEAYWDEPNPITTVFISGLYDLGENANFNNFYIENFQQKDSSFVFANLIISNEEDLEKLGFIDILVSLANLNAEGKAVCITSPKGHI